MSISTSLYLIKRLSCIIKRLSGRYAIDLSTEALLHYVRSLPCFSAVATLIANSSLSHVSSYNRFAIPTCLIIRNTEKSHI